MEEQVVVIGGGIAGLTAAIELSKTCAVTVLEARDRFGGRIHTVRGPEEIPYELGAEFVHGKAPEITKLIQAARLRTHEVPDRHWKTESGTLIELSDFWEQLSSVTEQIKPNPHDTNFARFLSQQRNPPEAIELAKGFVEGFHAAPLEQVSVQATLLSEESSEDIDGQKAFRIHAGFDQLVRYLETECRSAGVQLRSESQVILIDWSRRPILIRLKGTRHQEINADRVIVTLPIGVLGTGEMQIIPEPSSKIDAIHALQMGMVTKVVLHFRKRFWPEPNFGFIHSNDEWFPTWWADERGDILTAWAGGPQGDELANYDFQFILERALKGTSKLFGEHLRLIRENMLAANTHNWKEDPFSKGAYSFIPVDGTEACRELARPERDRLFFAGEATDLNYQFGTVHGAIASGQRAARDLEKVLE